jgi:cysteine desulfuration protein SufE
MTIQEIENQIIEDFSVFEDPMDRYDYIMDIGKKMPAFPEEFRRDELLVQGCQSQVWLHVKEDAGKIIIQADSNTAIAKGVVSLLVQVFSGQTPETILASDLSFLEKIQLRALLTSQRSNGLTSMINKIKMYAKEYVG